MQIGHEQFLGKARKGHSCNYLGASVIKNLPVIDYKSHQISKEPNMTENFGQHSRIK